MRKKEYKQLFKILLSLLLFVFAIVLPLNPIITYILYGVSFILVAYSSILKALQNIVRGKILDENFLMSIATIGAISIKEPQEAIAVMLFYQTGELFQSYAVDKSRKSIASLMDIRPDYANVYRQEKIEKVTPEEVSIGEIIFVKPGEKIPLDGIIIEGESMLNTIALTGESIPRKVQVQDTVLNGCINNTGTLKIKVTKPYEESTVSKILELVENASNKKSKSENFISRFAKYYTPIVVLIALFLALLPPLFLKDTTWMEWIHRSLSFLVVSCPCALVISIPLSFFGGIGAASKIGVLVKGSNYLEALAHTEIIMCDKTGTLTEGVFEVQKIDTIGYTEEELLKYTAYAESFSNHPISLSIQQAYGKEIKKNFVTEVQEIAGKGISAKVEQKHILVGNEKLLEEHQISFKQNKDIGTILYIAIEGQFAGTILIRDKIKKDAYKAIQEWKQNKVEKIIMLTGDQEDISSHVAKELKIDEYYTQLLPQNKVEIVEKWMTKKSSKGKLLFLGDGINDAPVLALADIGVAMGNAGSDAAIEAADIVIMTDEPSKITKSIQLSKKTMRIVKENIILALTVKIVVLLASALGITNMWFAVFADVGVSILAIINSLRMLKIKRGDL